MQPLAPEDPAHIGPYRLVARLGAGGMGRVFLCRGEDGRTAAVKLVRGEVAEQEEFRRRFAREVAAARRVSGEWTAGVLEADTSAELPWVATEYVPGPTLRAVVRGDFGPLPSASAHVLAHRLAQALQAVHGAGLVHRDLKPSNILLTVNGPRVIDFGIARALDTSPDSTLTPAGSLLGTPEFMSPEQVRGERVGPAGDVFSLGSVLVYAATGRSPFVGESGSDGMAAHALMFRIAYEEPDLTGVPEVIVDLVRECLAKEPGDRPAVADVVGRTRRAPAGAWLPGELLDRLDRAAAQPVPEGPRRGEPEGTGAPGLTGFPDFPEPVEWERPRDLLDMPEAGIAPPRVRETAVEPRSRVRLWAAVALLVTLVALGSGLTLEAATAIRGALSGGGSEPAVQTPARRPSFAGAWRLTLGGHDPLFTVRLDLVEGAAPGEKGATVLAATSNAICAGSAKVVSRADTVLTLGGFDVRRIGPGDGKASSRCGLPLTMRIASDRDDSLTWLQSEEWSLGFESAGDRELRVPKGLQGAWYADQEGLRVTVLPGRVGSLAVRGVQDHDGLHCEWEAALMDIGWDGLVTTGAQIVEAGSDPTCASSQAPYTYDLMTIRVLTRSSPQGATVLHLRRHP
ncbi:serine/threonine-protein kinase [Streptomyces sp. S.PB5]|uniref:serine/threonine-protein kinase n=1 Tax=Streptomyces sp. S.PB5 TaxID=3020844 RepID=UPI0025B0F1A4|nr:serine/threonine-protein kinase [Streptomyces sp. S.PB5]MDN3026420.1 serine/threonine-protein kinase [Streptomyces sp. S.PB5]